MNIPDTTYKNVVEIMDKNVVKDGHNYLFDKIIPKDSKSPVVFVTAEVPSNLLTEIYPEFRRLTVITPNWKFYKKSPFSQGEPIASSVIYQLNRENEKVINDSLVIIGGFPKMEFVTTETTAKNILKVYYTERYGSICCLRDPKWDIKPSIQDFISDFELKNKMRIINTYADFAGVEGEVIYYFSLTGLSNKLRLKFILERTAQVAVVEHLKSSIKKPRIYTPNEVIIYDGIKTIDK